MHIHVFKCINRRLCVNVHTSSILVLDSHSKGNENSVHASRFPRFRVLISAKRSEKTCRCTVMVCFVLGHFWSPAGVLDYVRGRGLCVAECVETEECPHACFTQGQSGELPGIDEKHQLPQLTRSRPQE